MIQMPQTPILALFESFSTRPLTEWVPQNFTVSCGPQSFKGLVKASLFFSSLFLSTLGKRTRPKKAQKKAQKKEASLVELTLSTNMWWLYLVTFLSLVRMSTGESNLRRNATT